MKIGKQFKNASVTEMRKSCWQDVKYLALENSQAVQYILEQAELNATQTIDEKTDLTWDQLFYGSVGSILSTGYYNRHVVAFFHFRGITY